MNITKGGGLSLNTEEVSESSEMLLLDLGALSRSSKGIGSFFMDVAGIASRSSRRSVVMDVSRTSFEGGGRVHDEELEATISGGCNCLVASKG